MRSCCIVLFHRLTGRPETPEVDETQPVAPITEASIPFSTPEKHRKIGPLWRFLNDLQLKQHGFFHIPRHVLGCSASINPSGQLRHGACGAWARRAVHGGRAEDAAGAGNLKETLAHGEHGGQYLT